MNRPIEPEDSGRARAEPVLRALDDWQSELDPVQRARLAAARRRALAERPAATSPLRWLAPALAAGVLLALGIGFWPQTGVPPTAAPVDAEAVAAGDPAANDDSLMDDDADYLLWLASNDAA